MTTVFRSRFAAIAVLAALALSACASGGAKFRPEAMKAGTGLVYVYWPPGILGSFKGLMTVTANGKTVGNIGPGIYYAIHLPAGVHKVGIGNHMNWGQALLGTDKVTVPVTAGQTYYIRMTQIMHTPTAHSINPERVGTAAGSVEIRSTSKG